MTPVPDDIVWLRHGTQRLGLLPAYGGSVACWDWQTEAGWVPLWRAWDGISADRCDLACFPMVPWVNRISEGGFEHAGRRFAVACNRADEPYPIHGAGWLAAWQHASCGIGHALQRLDLKAVSGQPWSFEATQEFQLVDDGLVQSLALTLRGDHALPCGIGLHPTLPRTPRMRLSAAVDGIWWREPTSIIPREQRADLPEGFDLRSGLGATGPQVDHVYHGWDGKAVIRWPEHQLTLHLHQAPVETPDGQRSPDHLVIYRPCERELICVEPQTQAIDAFHLPGTPGLIVLEPGQRLAMKVHWRVEHGG